MYRSMIQTGVDYIMSLTQRAESQMNLVQRAERQMSLVLWAEREVGIAQRIHREMNSMELMKQHSASTAWMSQCCLSTVPARLPPLMISPEQPAISDDEEPAEYQRDRVGFLGRDGRPRR